MQIPAIVLSFSKADELGNFLDNRLNETLIESGYNTEYFEAWDLLQRNVRSTSYENVIMKLENDVKFDLIYFS